MKKLAKLSAVFTVICMALALGACGHSGSDYDWKNPDGSSDSNGDPGSGSGANEVLTLTREWDGGYETFIFYDDDTFYYTKSVSGTITENKGTYEGDFDGELVLSVTSGNWGDGNWQEEDGSYGFILEVSGDTATGSSWWGGDPDDTSNRSSLDGSFTKVEEEEEPEIEDDTTQNPEDTGDTGDTGDTEPEVVFENTVKSVMGNEVSFILYDNNTYSCGDETGTYAKDSGDYDYKLTASSGDSGYYLTTSGTTSCAYWYIKDKCECVEYDYTTYTGTWEPYSWSNSDDWSEYIVLQEGGTFYYWLVDGNSEKTGAWVCTNNGSWKGSYTYTDVNKQMTLTTKAYWEGENPYGDGNGKFDDDSSGNYGLYMTIDEYGYATVTGYNSSDHAGGIYKKTSDKYEK